jgi:hypothetical protein
MTKKPPTICLMLLAGLLGMPGSMKAEPGWSLFRLPPDPVIVSSTAADDYSQRKFGSGAPKPETYLFFQGKFYGGVIRDHDLEHAQFGQIVQVLGRDLVQQNYFPTKDPKDADLLIVVHWGTTEVYQDDLATSMALPNNGGTTAPTRSMGMLQQFSNEDRQINMEMNAHLLGYGQQLSQRQAKASTNTVTNDEYQLLMNLGDERYFVILMAYDFRTMKKGVRPKLLWSTRFSMQGPGNRFTSALPVMSHVAASYFGHADGVKNVNVPRVPDGKVEVGKPTVVGDGK